jgi:hypothetical protein
VLILSVFVAGILAALAGLMKRHEDVLDRRGRRTTALVVSSDYRRRLPDTATVRYQHDGREYETRLTVSDSDDFGAGSQREIIYDPEHPRHAKPVQGWETSYSDVNIVALIVLGLGVANSARRAVPTALVRSARAQGTAMRVETFQMTRWWQRYSRQWAALWPPGADPTSVDASLYVPIEGLTGKDPIGFEQPSTVYGEPVPGSLLVIVHGDRALWPRGRAQRDPPRRAEVAGRVQRTGDWW